MARKQLGPAPSVDEHAATKKYVDDKAVFAIPFHVSGSVTTGSKAPQFIAPFAMTITMMRGVCASGASATYRPTKNGSVTGNTSASTGTTVITTAQSVALAAGDRLGVNVVSAGTGVDLSITFGAVVT